MKGAGAILVAWRPSCVTAFMSWLCGQGSRGVMLRGSIIGCLALLCSVSAAIKWDTLLMSVRPCAWRPEMGDLEREVGACNKHVEEECGCSMRGVEGAQEDMPQMGGGLRMAVVSGDQKSGGDGRLEWHQGH